MSRMPGVFKLSVLLVLCMLFATTAIQAQHNWKLISETDEVMLYRLDSIRTVQEYKAVFHLNGSLNEVASYVSDANHYKDWITGLEEVIEMEELSDSAHVCLFKLDVWPVFKRDGVFLSTIKHEQDEVIFELELDSIHKYPLEEQCVKYFRVRWELKPTGTNQTAAQMFFFSRSMNYSDWVFEIVNHVYSYSFNSMIEDLIDQFREK